MKKKKIVCFELITYRNSKMRRNHPLLKKQMNVSKKVWFDFFLSLLGNKTPKFMQNTLYRETKRY